MIIVTGGAGFIGSGMVRRLNEEGITDIWVVDDLDHPIKKKNLRGKRYRKIVGIDAFIKKVQKDEVPGKVRAVFHMGAISSTTEKDPILLRKRNLGYSKQLAEWALAKHARFVYASSAATYGEGEQGYSDDLSRIKKLKPLNLYGWSKQVFDRWVLHKGLQHRVLGLKFFNVFGPNESHKGEMRSLVDKAFLQVQKSGKIRLFKSHRKGIGHGEQTRDFIYVKDVCEVMLYALKHPKFNGIFNVGTGKARNWNDLAKAVFDAMGKKPVIEYIDMPAALRGKYQYHTQADPRRLFKASKNFKFRPLEDAVADYVKNHLVPGRQW